jgi:NADH dehydrogenase
MHRVVVVGAGFGGLSAARTLIGKDVDVTIVDQRNFHTFQPLLYEVATAGLDTGDVAYPIRVIFGKADNVTFRMAEVTGVDWELRQVLLAVGAPLPFDSLIVATGATAKFFGIPGASEYSFPLYTLTDARRLRDHILRRLEDVDAHPEGSEARGALTFVVVGGGPTGVEVAGALAELLDVAVRHDGFRFERSAGRIILVDALDRLLTPFERSASAYAAETLAGRGIELRLGHLVKAVGAGEVELEDGSVIPTRTVVWAGGVSVEHTVAADIDAPTGPNGRLVVGPDLAVVGHEGVYAVGDAAAVLWGGSGPVADTICPQVAQVAIQSGGHAARQILATLDGRATTPFAYKDKGIMATIGRRAAVTQFRSGRVIRGTLGWLAWLGLHLFYLVGFRNKIVVFINWSWRYLSWGSGPRIIVSEESVVDDDGDRPREEGPSGGPLPD